MRIRMACILTAVFCLMTGTAVTAQQTGFEEIEGTNGKKIYVLSPEGSSGSAPEEGYATVYLMPQNGCNAQQYLYDRVDQTIRELEQSGQIAEMVYVCPELDASEEPLQQIKEVIEIVGEHYPVSEDANQRGILGTGAGAYLAFYAGYGLDDGKPDEEPQLFRAIGSQDGDFTSEANPYCGQYGSIYDMLSPAVDSSYGNDTKWVANYYTYIDSNSDSALAWADGGSNEIAALYRSDLGSIENSSSAWDYSVFEYSTRTASHYGVWMDNLDRSLNRFSIALGQTVPDMQTEETETEYVEKETVVEGSERCIDLAGSWQFAVMPAITEKLDELDLKTGESVDVNSIDIISLVDWKKWDKVQPGQDWWGPDFASCLNGNQYFTGYAWYVREFEVPEGFDTSGLVFEGGMVDEGDEVFLNGVRIGSTGIPEEGGSYDNTNPWDEERIYEIPDDLLKTGTNVIAMRMCNSSGAGGWYSGPICIRVNSELQGDPEEEKQTYFTTSFSSKALKGTEIEYRVFLPEGYYDSNLRYPTVYMLHGYGSTGKSFEIAGLPEVLKEGIASGEIPPCIVIFPSDGHPQKAGWWAGAYGTMLNEDLIAEVDSRFRTVDSREYRFLAGESMGGGGAYLNAILHPELYGGVFDMYGALSYTGSLGKLLNMSAEELSQMKQYIICGNHDMYGFDTEHLLVGKKLVEEKVPHVFEIDNGEHSSSFYMPYIKEGMAYILSGLTPVGDEAQTEDEI